jgi:transposase
LNEVMTMNQTGIDVSNQVFDATRNSHGRIVRKCFSNDKRGHRQFIRWAVIGSSGARVALEATGIYHLQLALALDEAEQIELMVINPFAARRFIQAHMVRAKTDVTDADGILEFVQRMPFKRWQAPRQDILQLQSLAHRAAQLGKDLSRERSRLHAARRAGRHCAAAQQDLEQHIEHLRERLERIRKQACAVIANDRQLADANRLIITAPGFAAISSMKLLAELTLLPADMRAPQWVAHAGLDPRAYQSGSSINRPRRISKQGNSRIRSILFIAALTAVRRDPYVAAFYEKLLQRGKKKMLALVAVMRKLLHAIWGMLNHRKEWEGNRFFQLPSPDKA